MSNIAMHGGKGFGGGEATRDPEPTLVDPNDPKGKQQAIHKAESFADYLAKRSGTASAPEAVPTPTEAPPAPAAPLPEPAAEAPAPGSAASPEPGAPKRGTNPLGHPDYLEGGWGDHLMY